MGRCSHVVTRLARKINESRRLSRISEVAVNAVGFYRRCCVFGVVRLLHVGLKNDNNKQV